MKKQYIEASLVVVYSLALAAFVWAALSYRVYLQNAKAVAAIPRMDITIFSTLDGWEAATGSGGTIYKIPYLKMRSIGFATKNNELFIKVKLADNLPLENAAIYQGEKITGVVYNISLSGHFFSNTGEINSTKDEAELKIGFYGAKEEAKDDNRIKVDGQLVRGGPGYDFFIIKYPYNQILLSQTNPVVFSAWSVAFSEIYRAGTGIYTFKNNVLSVKPEDPSQIKIDLLPPVS